MAFKFTKSFKNSVGVEVAGVWFDEDRREWRVSTEAIRGFASEQDAVGFYRHYCDPETGLPGKTTHHDGDLLHKLVDEVHRGDTLRRQGEALAEDVRRAIVEQRESVRRFRSRLAKRDPAKRT